MNIIVNVMYPIIALFFHLFLTICIQYANCFRWRERSYVYYSILTILIPTSPTLLTCLPEFNDHCHCILHLNVKVNRPNVIENESFSTYMQIFGQN